jgi:cyclophilin family peptidyl-prolyl cis-trans isomerase
MKLLTFLILTLVAISPRAATIATFSTPVGAWEIELYDAEKPVTVSNFIKYATSGRYLNQFIHRWVPGFVIQGGGYRVDISDRAQIVPVPVFGAITNESHVGPFLSNTNGTIAMARVGGQVNSATSQWFINLGDNSGPPPSLDTLDNGFTVFGRVTAGMNVVNLFVPPPPSVGIYTNYNIIPGSPTAVLTPSNNITVNDLLYVQVSLRRDMSLQITRSATGERRVSWFAIPGVTNVLEYTSDPALATWSQITNFVPSGGRVQITDSSNDRLRLYRVLLFY